MDIEPDDKDWTWVLDRPCQECGLAAGGVPFGEIAGRVRADLPRWVAALKREDAGRRPDPTTWSVIEYACHVRDVHSLFAERITLMLSAVDPEFTNWDQDLAAIEDGYASQDPDVVAAQLVAAAESMAATLEGVAPEVLVRTGRRSNGSMFTVETLAQYYLHDVVHHLVDIRG